MALRNSDDFGISDDDIKEIAKQLELQAESVKSVVIDTVNSAADDVVERGIGLIAQNVNLTPDYIRKHLKVSKYANKSSDSATVSATKRPVLLSRFDARQEFRNSVDKRRGENRRVQGGVSVRVKANGARKTMPGAFLIKLKGSGAMGVAVRPNDTSKLNKSEWKDVDKHGYAILHGPSVDQIFHREINSFEPSLDELMDKFIRKLNSV